MEEIEPFDAVHTSTNSMSGLASSLRWIALQKEFEVSVVDCEYVPALAISAWLGQLAVVATLASTYNPRQWLTGFSDEYDKVHVNDTLSVTRTLSAPPHPFRCCVY